MAVEGEAHHIAIHDVGIAHVIGGDVHHELLLQTDVSLTKGGGEGHASCAAAIGGAGDAASGADDALVRRLPRHGYPVLIGGGEDDVVVESVAAECYLVHQLGHLPFLYVAVQLAEVLGELPDAEVAGAVIDAEVAVHGILQVAVGRIAWAAQEVVWRSSQFAGCHEGASLGNKLLVEI